MINAHTVTVNLEVLPISLVANQILGGFFDPFFQRANDGLTVMSILSGPPVIETDDVAAAVQNNFLNLEGRGVFRGFPLGMNLPEATRTGEHITFDLVYFTHPGSKNVRYFSFLEFLYSLRTDHSAVCHNAKLTCMKAGTDTVYHRNQCTHIRRIARPHLAADWLAIAVYHRPDNHLVQIRTMIPTVSLLT